MPAIDGLRAIAVLSVLLYHVNPAWLPGGLTGVDIFFAISGFVVPASILWRPFDSAGGALGFFYTRRVYRILPALIVMLVVASFLVILFVPRSWLGDGIIGTALAAFIGASNFVLYSLDGDYFSPRATNNPFLHTWSLAVEEQFYLLFSGVLGLIYARRRDARPLKIVWVGLTFLTVGSFLLALRTSSTAPAFAFYLLPARFWELGVGVLAYLFLPAVAFRLRRMRPAVQTGATTIAILGLLVSLVRGTPSGQPYPLPAVVPGVFATAFLMASTTARPTSSAAAALSWPPLRYLGLISYSLYLWHWPVFVLMRWTIGFSSAIQVSSGVAISFCLAVLSYRLVETPLRAFAADQRVERRSRLGIAVCVGLLAFATVFVARQSADRLSLSVTADTETWFPYKIDRQHAAACPVDVAETAFASGRMFQLRPRCGSKLGKHRLFVAGDSHAMAYQRMMEEFASDTGVPVTLLVQPGCPVLFGRDPPQAGCRSFSEAALLFLDSEARPDDAVFFPALRMPKAVGEPNDQSPTVPVASQSDLVSEAVGQLTPLLTRKTPIIIEAPQPVFSSAAYRCADWFNRNNPVCGPSTIARPQFDAERRPLLLAMESVVAAQPSVSIWDPSELFCDQTICRSWLGKKPVYFDKDHFSGFANDLMLPRFRALVAKLLHS